MNTFAIMRLIGNAPASLLNSIETAILMRMALFGDRSGKDIRPGIIELSKKTKICEKSVRNSLSSLIKKEIVIISSIRKHGSSDKSCYEINVKLLEEIILGKVPVPDTVRVPVLDTGTFSKKNKKVPVSHSKVPVSGTGTVPVPDTGTPYTTPLLNPDQQSNVELASNSTSQFSKKISEEKNDLKEKQNSDKVKEVFDHWRKELNHPKSKIDGPRKTKILNALKLGFSVEDLKKVIDSVKKTPWNMGENPSGKKYHDIGLIFRDSDQIERFLDNFDTQPRVEQKNVATASKSAFWQNTKIMSDLLESDD